ncbi:NAD-dependent epimerase/dehydratase family protein [Roseicyclus sp. F158]|uniref:NAD-dependent epimerase/dehydratase family protein n=1 Tax=Tropicimonas omnivorans TaxID=3075590 RepID=A0ABU3DLF8_9RHOB|nr:NAD-dependent epimerase/dehydratase family protein [Roseicyclus sp. F158]MDT0684528.1 NAD-dependent epimerase/dehydratase family protein [Roseicyclus sp. F158]
MQILITGAEGFIGRNLSLRLRENGHGVLRATRQTTPPELAQLASQADAVVHLAGANRPDTEAEFTDINDKYTEKLCAVLRSQGPIPVIAASTIQVERDTPYGRTKRAGEAHLLTLARDTGAPINICRLVNVFGKWCRPNYNSVVATFCHNIARDLPIQIDIPTAEVRLVHVDDVIDGWLAWLAKPGSGEQVTAIAPEYRITLRDLADRLRGYRAIRQTHTVGDTGSGLGRALYATYVSYLPVADFAYKVTRHGDARGVFAEMLRTEHSGQFSFFTARPGVTRGGHYHHAKTEKFLVLKGQARFRFLNMDTGESHIIDTTGEQSLIVETVPGWSHDITNTGEGELICMLWANELFDRDRPDTFARPLTN